MARSRSFTSRLYGVARTANTVSAVASGHPKRVVRRAQNIVVGRVLARAGIWQKLWRGGE
jgi:hypothetical protein